MKKLILLLIVITSIFYNVEAQTYDTTTLFGKSGYIFNYVSRTQITTGLLRDYGIDFLNLDNFAENVVEIFFTDNK
jgi:mRNA deadenylase 3'-5' endonuclease subunit Ccr4